MDFTHLTYIDLETTGLDPERHEILEIGILKPTQHMPFECVSSIPLEGWSAFVCKVAPTHLETADPRALEVNGYSHQEWQDALPFAEAMHQVRPLFEGALLVGHNLWLDCEFLGLAFRRLGLSVPAWKYRLDTSTLIWEHLGRFEHSSLSLEAACEVLGIDNAGSHRVLPDMLRTKAVADRLTARVPPWPRP